MKPLLRAAVLGMIVACAPARTTPPSAPTPVPAPTAGAPAPNAPAPNAVVHGVIAGTSVDEPPQDWQLLDIPDGFAGIGVRRAERELLGNRQPKREVLVAVIDGGVDTAHVDLRAHLWMNPKERSGKDGDGDGLAGDVYGWNFIGGADGRDVDQDTYEVTRLQARCLAKSLGGDSLATLCPKVDAEYTKARASAEREVQEIQGIGSIVDATMRVLHGVIRDSITPARVRALTSSNPEVQQARARFLQMAASGITPAVIDDARKDAESGLKYKLNLSFDSRLIVGDTYADLSQRRYGNADVMGPDAKHGTHVTGIIGAVRGNGVGLDGIASSVRVMMVRAVPDGDERDKDIANAIRYAVDHGAQIINMSFGKGWSPQKQAVDEAVRYADAHGVLMVHAAGNDGEDIGVKPSFPTPFYLGGGRAANWIEVGASSWKGGDRLASEFSNYSADRVDVFAPGSDIYSTVPGGYEKLSGTSMATPVVAGAAAMLMSYFPELGAADIKRILLASATRFDQKVVRPGSENERVPFSSLSASGGIINVYAAVKMAMAREVRP